MLNLNLIYNQQFIIIIIIIIIIILLFIYYFYYYKIINFQIQSVDPILLKSNRSFCKISNTVIYYNHSLIDKYPPNNKKFSEFNKAKFYTIELKAGSSLFIPAGWWHWVFSEGNCIAFSHIIHNFDENAIKEKQNQNYKEKTIIYYDNNNDDIDFMKHSIESIPLVYNNSNINKITDTFLEKTLDKNKINLLVSKTNTIVTVNKPENTTTTIINGNYNYFNILNNSSNYYSYIGMTLLNKDIFKLFINKYWENFANIENKKNDIYLWHSKKNIDTGLHYDITDNLITVHSGKKKVMLFPPSETKYLYNELMNNTNNYAYFTLEK